MREADSSSVREREKKKIRMCQSHILFLDRKYPLDITEMRTEEVCEVSVLYRTSVTVRVTAGEYDLSQPEMPTPQVLYTSTIDIYPSFNPSFGVSVLQAGGANGRP